MLRASSCAFDSTVLLRGVSSTPRSSPNADEEVTVVGRMSSPRLMPCTTISSRSSAAVAGEAAAGADTAVVEAVICCACPAWEAVRIENVARAERRVRLVTDHLTPIVCVHSILLRYFGRVKHLWG